jgi:hypothetical protein
MSKNKFFLYEAPNLTEDELKLYEHYKKCNPIEIALKIWDLMATNTVIPKELQPFVGQALSAQTKRYERDFRDTQIVLDMEFKIFEDGVTIEDAATQIAAEYNLAHETILRIYKNGKYSKKKKYLKKQLAFSVSDK